jgi:hypothetical protein
VHVCICTYVPMYVFMHVGIHVFICLCVYVRESLCICVFFLLCMYLSVDGFVHLWIYGFICVDGFLFAGFVAVFVHGKCIFVLLLLLWLLCVVGTLAPLIQFIVLSCAILVPRKSAWFLLCARCFLRFVYPFSPSFRLLVSRCFRFSRCCIFCVFAVFPRPPFSRRRPPSFFDPSIQLSVFRYVYLSINLCVYLCIYLSVYLSICQYVHLSISMPLFLYLYLYHSRHSSPCLPSLVVTLLLNTRFAFVAEWAAFAPRLAPSDTGSAARHARWNASFTYHAAGARLACLFGNYTAAVAAAKVRTQASALPECGRYFECCCYLFLYYYVYFYCLLFAVVVISKKKTFFFYS